MSQSIVLTVVSTEAMLHHQILLTRGTHTKLVKHLLGHALISMNLDRYSHRIPSMGRHVTDGMDEALG